MQNTCTQRAYTRIHSVYPPIGQTHTLKNTRIHLMPQRIYPDDRCIHSNLVTYTWMISMYTLMYWSVYIYYASCILALAVCIRLLNVLFVPGFTWIHVYLWCLHLFNNHITRVFAGIHPFWNTCICATMIVIV